MLKDIVRFEWRYHTRQMSFVAAVLLFALFGFVVTATGFGPDNVHVDSPYSIAQSIGMLSLLSVFVLAAFCANAVVRDSEYKFEEIVFTTPVEKLPFLGGRFLGSFLAAFTAFAACVAGMLAARFMPWQDADRLGDFTLIPYLWALLVIALPNLLFAAILLFALATMTRSILASYAGSVLIYVLYFVASAMTNSPLMAASAPGANEGASLAPLLDPFALSAFFDQTQHWTPAVRNTRLLSLSGAFLLNRVLWIGMAVAGFAAVYRIFSFGLRRQKPPLSPSAAKTQKQKRRLLPPHSIVLELRSFLGNLPFLAMCVLWAALVVSELIGETSGGEYGAAFYPTASLLFDTIRTPLTLIATILLVYITAEIVWRERTLRFSGILDATPASNATFVLAKCATAVAMVLVLTAVALLAGAALQVAKGWPVEPLVLLSFAYFLAAPLVLFAILAIVVQTLSPHKYAGMFFVLLLAMLTLQGARFGLNHPLLRFASTPPVAYSDFNGFGDTSRFHLFVLYWSALAALLLLVAIRAWREGTRERISRPLAAAFATLFIATGAFLYVDTDTEDPRELRADYEKQYKRLAMLPVPRIEAVRAEIDLDGRNYRTRGEYVLANRTAQPIGTLLVSTRKRHHVIRLREPLQPSHSIAVRFDFRGESDLDVYYRNALPHIGYREGYELDDPRDRRRYGLPPAKRERAEHELPSPDWSHFDVTVSTRGDEIAVAPGRLVRDWRRNGRRFFHYRSDGHAPHRFGVASARYAVQRATHRGVPVEIYHHPAHAQNVPRMMRAATDSLRTFEAAFGPYTHPHLRIAEVPVPEFSGYAYPGMVLLGEKRGFLIDARDPRRLDLVTRRTAHEVAHQWWGYTLLPANAPGASMLMESLTKYAELLVLESTHGREQIRQSLAYELDRYLKDRTAERGAEPPLARVDDQAYLYYRKGAIVMYAIRDLIGTEAVNAALNDLMRAQGGPHRRPMAAHLVERLRAVTPPQHRPLVDEWVNDVVLYDLKLDSAATRRLADGRYEVTLRITASKQRDDGRRVPMRDPVDVGVFAADDTPLHLAKHTLRDGQQLIRVVVAGEPRIAAVDPYVCRIDRNRFDNTRVCPSPN